MKLANKKQIRKKHSEARLSLTKNVLKNEKTSQAISPAIGPTWNIMAPLKKYPLAVYLNIDIPKRTNIIKYNKCFMAIFSFIMF